MNTQEWSLIVFTVLAQMSVGSFLILGIVHYLVRRAEGAEQADRFSDFALLAIGPVLALAMLASLGHLGNPINAPRAITNLTTSWLSREILFGVLFTIGGAAFAFMQWRKLGSYVLRGALAFITALIGLVFVYSMSQVYMLPSQPAWDNIATPISFFATTLLLGLFAMGGAFVGTYAYMRRSDPDCAAKQCTLLRRTLRWIAVASVIVIGVQLVTLPLYLAQLSAGSAAAAETARIMVQENGLLLGLRITLAFAGGAILALFIYQNASSPGREQIAGNLAYGAFALVLVAEVIGRYLFYATHVGIGV